MQEKREERNNENQDCMSLEGFGRYMKIAIQQRLGNSFLVSLQQIRKNNGLELYALTILQKESNLSPTIYLDFYYNQYKNGRSLEEMEQNILEVYEQEKISVELDMSFFTEWEQVQKRIVFKLVNYEQNRELLKEIPYVPFLDLAVIPYYLLEVEEESHAVIQIQKKHLEMWNITEQQVLETAKENTPKLMPFVLQSMTSVMAEVLDYEEENIPKGLMETEVTDMLEVPLYVLTNSYKLYGAGCMLYQNVLADFADKVKSDLYIIPSSIHEVLILPVTGGKKDAVDLSKMVKEVNETGLKEEDVLSDHVYKFTRETGKITR